MDIIVDTITKADASQLDSLAEMYGVTLRDDYSGRGMYGTKCFGIDYDLVSAWDVAKYLIEALGYDRACEMMEQHTMDSMGLGYIHYFPGVIVEEGVEFLHDGNGGY